MSTSMRPHATHQSQSRQHPYNAPGTKNGPSGGASGRKWARNTPDRERDTAAMRAPPSPPRSQRDSGSPPVGLGAAFGGKEGGKWWDEALPAPPASLSAILDSFRRSGEGDRDLLLAILGAKKAEEERLTSLIQTRLTILQARLSVHATSAQLDAQAQATAASMPPPPPASGPMASSSSSSGVPMSERTPSLTSRGSTTSSTGPLSPTLTASYSTSYDRDYPKDREYAISNGKRSSAPEQYHHQSSQPFHLPPPSGLWRRHNSPLPEGPGPIRVETHRAYLPTMPRNGKPVDGQQKRERSPVSPRSSDTSGIDMLIDAGRRVSESRND